MKPAAISLIKCGFIHFKICNITLIIPSELYFRKTEDLDRITKVIMLQILKFVQNEFKCTR